jgi:hypothetical protein
MMSERQLPERFQHLEPFLSWALATERERAARRHATDMAEIRAFYDAMLSRLGEILAFLEEFSAEDIPAEVNQLFLLSLSLAEIAPAVENFGQPGVVDGYEFSRFIPLHN